MTRTLRHSLGALVVVSSVIACRDDADPRGQILLYVDTDAVVPRAGEPGMVDRVRFDIMLDGMAVPNGTRDFLVDEQRFRERDVSIGLVPHPRDAGVSVRVRLFRDDRAPGPEPSAGVALDTTVRLPPVAETGVVRFTVFLSALDFGRRIGHPAPVDPRPGAPEVSAVSTSALGRRTPCADDARDDEVCVPGGFFFFGDPALRGRTAVNDITNERLVVIAPFHIDRREVTVADFRRAWPLAGAVAPPLAWSGRSDGSSVEDFCTWREVADPNGATDDLPLNCASWDTARAYCASLGKDLPSEAQIEYLMSGMGRELSYPWGEDEPACAWAVWGRAGIGFFRSAPADCRPERTIGGPVSPGAGARDAIAVGGRAVLDLGGNVAEWARDLWSRETEPFWAPVTPMQDPVADFAGSADGDHRPVRGGRWSGGPLGCRAGHRLQNPRSDVRPSIGFRCARAARQP